LLGRDQVALVYVDRTAAPKIKLRTSADGGRTWPPETELVGRHAGAHFDRTGVEWCRVR